MVWGEDGWTRSARSVTPDAARGPGRLAALGVVVGVLLSGALVLRDTSAAFTGVTENAVNAWAAGSVALTDDDAGAALFAATDLLPGSTGQRCLTVTYTGTLATTVRLYTAAATDTGSAAAYVDLVVEEGSGGGFGSCAGFAASSTIFSGTLASFTASRIDHTSGVGTWAPAGSASRVYRIRYTVNAAIPQDRQGASTTTTFQWESRT